MVERSRSFDIFCQQTNLHRHKDQIQFRVDKKRRLGLVLNL